MTQGILKDSAGQKLFIKKPAEKNIESEYLSHIWAEHQTSFLPKSEMHQIGIDLWHGDWMWASRCLAWPCRNWGVAGTNQPPCIRQEYFQPQVTREPGQYVWHRTYFYYWIEAFGIGSLGQGTELTSLWYTFPFFHVCKMAVTALSIKSLCHVQA